MFKAATRANEQSRTWEPRARQVLREKDSQPVTLASRESQQAPQVLHAFKQQSPAATQAVSQ